VGLAIGLFFFAGCAVNVDGPSPASAPTPSAASASSEPASPESSNAFPKPTEPITQPAGASTYPADGEARRSHYADSIDLTLSCPTGELVITPDLTLKDIRVTEDCRKITVDAVAVDLLTEHVDTLIITPEGGADDVIVRSVNNIVINSDLCDLYWDQGKPKSIRNTGFGNHANPNPAPEP
jgi:hypothetical protein